MKTTFMDKSFIATGTLHILLTPCLGAERDLEPKGERFSKLFVFACRWRLQCPVQCYCTRDVVIPVLTGM